MSSITTTLHKAKETSSFIANEPAPDEEPVFGNDRGPQGGVRQARESRDWHRHDRHIPMARNHARVHDDDRRRERAPHRAGGIVTCRGGHVARDHRWQFAAVRDCASAAAASRFGPWPR